MARRHTAQDRRRNTSQRRKPWAVAATAALLPLAALSLLPGQGAAQASPIPSATADPTPAPLPAVDPVDESADAASSSSDLIRLRDTELDTSAKVPAPASLAAEPSDRPQLRLVQLPAAVTPAGYAAIARIGTVVGYIPDNAYLVWTSAAGAQTLNRMAAGGKTLSYSGPFDPAYRLSPQLASVGKSATTDVTVQVVANAAGTTDLADVTDGRTVLAAPYELAGLRTVSVRVPSDEIDDIASLPAVVNVEPYAVPHPNDERQDQLLAGNLTTTGDNKTVPSGPGYLSWLAQKGFPTDPAAYPKVVVVDDGVDNGTTSPLHPDFRLLGDTTKSSRVSSNNNCTADAAGDSVGGHGNLNAGIVGGYNDTAGSSTADAGGYHYGLGVSPYGSLGSVKIFRNNGAYDLSACGNSVAGLVGKVWSDGARIATNSWGADVNGAYNADAQAYDALTRDASTVAAGNQELLEIFSAGNDGPTRGTIGSPGTAKNVLTIGATENVRDNGSLDGCSESNGDNDSDIATFSSRGPTSDGRSKPELVAAGTHVEGPASQAAGYDGSSVCGGPGSTPANRYYPAGQTLYTWSSGTSHSTPAVAGAASLTQQYYGRVVAAGQTASPAMLKALLTNVPRYLNGSGTGGTLPSLSQGYGVPDLGALFDPTTHRLVDDQKHLLTSTGQSFAQQASVTDPTKPVRVTLAWTDAPGSTVGAAYVNNLDLVVTAGGRQYRGNVMQGATSVPGGVADAKNNVENVFLPAGTTGPVTIQVLASNLAGDGVPGNGIALDQDFALTASDVDAVSAPTSNGFVAGLVVRDADFDNNTTYDPGETLTIDARVSNSGDAPTAPSTGTLQVVSGAATVVSGSTSYGAVAPGTTTAGTQPFQVHIDDAVGCGTTVVLRRSWAVDGRTLTEDTALQVGSPPAVSSTYSTYSNSTAVAIPDNSAAGATSSLSVSGNQTVGALRVGFTVTHTWDNDLTFVLTAPDGTAATLVSRVGSSGDNFTNTTLDDAAATPITSGTAPFSGTYRPQAALSTFAQKPAAGTWSLKVTDGFTGDTGTLQSWSLQVAPMLPAQCVTAGPSVRIGLPGPVVEGTSADVPVTLLDADASSHTVTFTPTDGTATATADLAAAPVTVTWAPGDPATKHVLIPTVSDGVTEGDETYTVAASASDTPVSAAVTGVIQDPTPGLSVATATAVTEGSGATLSFPVTLTRRATAGTYTVHVATSGGSASAGTDYTAVNRTLTWAPGDPDTQTVSVTVLDDAAVEPTETVTLVLDTPTGSPLPVISVASASGSILDTDTVPPTTPPATPVKVSLSKASVKEGDRGSTTMKFTVTLSAPSSSAVSFTWKTADKTATAPKDYKAGKGTVVVPAGATTATIRVKVLGDTVRERTEKLKVLAAALSANATWGGKPSATGKVLNDD